MADVDSVSLTDKVLAAGPAARHPKTWVLQGDRAVSSECGCVMVPLMSPSTDETVPFLPFWGSRESRAGAFVSPSGNSGSAGRKSDRAPTTSLPLGVGQLLGRWRIWSHAQSIDPFDLVLRSRAINVSRSIWE